jgi:hypothetical protein
MLQSFSVVSAEMLGQAVGQRGVFHVVKFARRTLFVAVSRHPLAFHKVKRVDGPH